MFAMFALSPDKILPVPMGGAEPQGLLRAENPPEDPEDPLPPSGYTPTLRGTHIYGPGDNRYQITEIFGW